jgi:hypothetical protein
MTTCPNCGAQVTYATDHLRFNNRDLKGKYACTRPVRPAHEIPDPTPRKPPLAESLDLLDLLDPVTGEIRAP